MAQASDEKPAGLSDDLPSLLARARAEKTLRQKTGGGACVAFAQLMARLQPLIVDWAGRFLRNAADVDEVVQVVMLTAYKHLEKLDPEMGLEAWVRRVTGNAAVDWLRQLRRRPTAPLGPEEDRLADPSLPPDRAAELLDDQELVRRLLGQLPEDDRAPLTLVYLEGMTYQEAATALGLQVAQLGSRLYRARERLRALFVENNS